VSEVGHIQALLNGRSWQWLQFVNAAMRLGLEVSFQRETVRVEGFRFCVHRLPKPWHPTGCREDVLYLRYNLVSARIHVISSLAGKMLVYLPHETPKWLQIRVERMPAERWPTPEQWQESRDRRAEILGREVYLEDQAEVRAAS
jgi:hypothetical protein